MIKVYLLIIAALFFANTAGWTLFIIQKRKWNSPFLQKYPPGHPMSPIPDLKCVESQASRLFRSGVKKIPGVDLNTDFQIKLLEDLKVFIPECPFLKSEGSSSLRYTFDNYFFTGTDTLLLYSLLRYLRPEKVIEIGSGFSSAAMLDTVEHCPDLKTRFTFIEPYPQRLKTLLKDNDGGSCTIIEDTLQNADLSLFTSLKAGDIIFIDSSHQMKPGSEVLYLMFEIIPHLNNGVLVHFHDVFWPFEYPEEWIKIGRSWNESYGLRAFLQNNNNYEIVFFNSYMGTVYQKQLEEAFPFGEESPDMSRMPGGNFMAGGSLWLRKKF